MTARYFKPELHGETEQQRKQGLAIMRGIRKLVWLGKISDWPSCKTLGDTYIVDEVYLACTRPE